MKTAEKLESERIDPAVFLDALGRQHTFQTFGEGPRKGDKRLSRVLHGTLVEHAATLAGLNAQGAGVYVTVNSTDGTGRKVANITATRALFADLDGAPLEPVTACLLPPHCVVETSPKRWHAYWFADGVPLDAFKELQQAIARRFGSDPKVCDLPRVMRLPGFQHRKGPPFTSRIVTINDGPHYTHVQLSREFLMPSVVKPPILSCRELADTIAPGGRNNTLFDLACGFARKGLETRAINSRLQKINAERCKPPLCATEVDAIASNASAGGSLGFVMLMHTLVDSPQWKALPPESCAITLAIFRLFNGSNNGRLALPWSMFDSRHGIASSKRFYRALGRIVRAGILVKVSDPRNSQSGRVPAMFAIADQFLPQVSKRRTGPSVETAHLNK